MSGWLEATNILAVRMDNIGDVIMLSPALRAIKRARPSARLTLLASPAGATAAPLLPWINDVIAWRAIWQDLGDLPFDPGRELELVATLRERQFDAALVFTSFSQTPHTPAYACYLAGIPLRAGTSKVFGGAVLTDELRCEDDALHQAERNLRLIEAVGYRVDDRRLTVNIPTAARGSTRALLREAGANTAHPYVIVHPGASADARRYQVERFAEVVALLDARGDQAVVTGSEREHDLIAAVCGDTPGAIPLVGRTSVAEYAAIVEGAAAVVCNDSLPMHLADAVGTPAVVLFSGTDLASQWRPRTIAARLLRRPTACTPCYRFDCPIGLPCLDIEPFEVVAALVTLLAGSRAAMREAARQ